MIEEFVNRLNSGTQLENEGNLYFGDGDYGKEYKIRIWDIEENKMIDSLIEEMHRIPKSFMNEKQGSGDHIKMLQDFKKSNIQIIQSNLIKNYTYEPLKKHKRKRIQKKWLKRYGYKPNKEAMQVGNIIYVSNLQYEAIRNLSFISGAK